MIARDHRHEPDRGMNAELHISLYFSLHICFSAHTHNYFYFYMMFLLLTFCINVLHRLIVNECILSPMFENKRRYNTIQYSFHKIRLLNMLMITTCTCISLFPPPFFPPCLWNLIAL